VRTFQDDLCVTLSLSPQQRCQPDWISVPIAGLLSRLPSKYREQKGEDRAGVNIDLPCRELFQGNTPRLPLARLQELLPGLVQIPEGGDPAQLITLPAGWLSLYYGVNAPKEVSHTNETPEEKQQQIKATPAPVVEKPTVLLASSTAALTLERLGKLDPQAQLRDTEALQSLFMTEENLTLERVIALAGELPGLRACVLAHGDQVVCASHTPAGIDLQTLSGQAMTMLSQIRESSSQMGLGTVPAITLHGDQGVLSFIHHGELCLLVLHADRGFVPGVRERLQEMVGHLSSARTLDQKAEIRSPLLGNR